LAVKAIKCLNWRARIVDSIGSKPSGRGANLQRGRLTG